MDEFLLPATFFREEDGEEVLAGINSILSEGMYQIESLLEKSPTVDYRLRAIISLHLMVDHVFSFITPYLLPAGTIQCKKGCSHCCTIRVEVLPLEAVLIGLHLLGRGKEVAHSYRKKMEAYSDYAQGRGSDGFDRLCPFLSEHGACGIYDIRPYKCRVHHSVDSEGCKNNVLYTKIGPIREFDMVLYPILNEIFTRHNVSPMPHEFIQAVNQVLQIPDLAEEFISGEERFSMLPELR